MATAKKRNGSYRALAYIGTVNGKRKYKSFTAPTKKEAERMAAEYVAEKDRIQSSAMTLGEVIDRYISTKENILSPTTINCYRSIRNNQLIGLMDRPIDAIAKEELQAAINKEAEVLSPKTIRNVYCLVSAVYKANELNAPTILLPKNKKVEMTIPTQDEINLLIDAFDQNEDMQLAIVLAAYLGLRRSEICALKMSDYKNSIITINKALVKGIHGKLVVKQPKSTAGYRKLPVPSIVARYLDKIKRNPDENIVRLNPDQITWFFVSRRKELFGTSKFRFHDFRHYYASVMLALGVPDKYAMERMGHSTNGVLKNVYQHLMQDKQQEITDTLNAYFEQYATKNATKK